MANSTARSIPGTEGETIRELKVRHKLTVTRYQIFLLILLIAGFVKDLALFGTILASLSKPMPVVAIRGTGEKDRLDYQTGLERSPAAVKSFVLTSMRNLHTWVNVLPLDGSPPDPGVLADPTAKSDKKIPTIVFRYSLAMEENFAREYRLRLADLIAASQLQDLQTQVAYKISQATEPIKLGDGTYRMSLVGVLMKYRPGKAPDTIGFNKTVTVKAIPPFTSSEAMRKYPKDENIAQALASVTADGLQIIDITEYKTN